MRTASPIFDPPTLAQVAFCLPAIAATRLVSWRRMLAGHDFRQVSPPLFSSLSSSHGARARLPAMDRCTATLDHAGVSRIKAQLHAGYHRAQQLCKRRAYTLSLDLCHAAPPRVDC